LSASPPSPQPSPASPHTGESRGGLTAGATGEIVGIDEFELSAPVERVVAAIRSTIVAG
jgi:hypothetical protein